MGRDEQDTEVETGDKTTSALVKNEGTDHRRSKRTDRQTDRCGSLTDGHKKSWGRGASLAGAVASTRVAVKVVIEAGRRAAGRIAPAVVEETPALQCLTLPPGVVHVQRAVTAVPATAWAVALTVAVLVPSLGLTGGSRAPWLLGDLRGCGRGLATRATPAQSAYTAEERDTLYR